MAHLVGVRLIYRQHETGDYYHWDLRVPFTDTTEREDEVDTIVLRRSALGKKIPTQDKIKTGPTRPPYGTPGRPLGPLPPHLPKAEPPESQKPSGRGREEHCVWVHRTDCNWEKFCAPEQPEPLPSSE
jgi:hypothetical protein